MLDIKGEIGIVFLRGFAALREINQPRLKRNDTEEVFHKIEHFVHTLPRIDGHLMKISLYIS